MSDIEFTKEEKTNLTNCDREPIHILGLINPHGLLLVLTEPDFKIVQLSNNTQEHLFIAPEQLLNKTWDAVIDAEKIAFIKNLIATEKLENSPHYLPTLTINGKQYEGLLHRSQGLLLLELERNPTTPSALPEGMYATLQATTAILQKTNSVTELCQKAAIQIRNFISFDRVMIYKFAEDDSGFVIAEAKREDLESFLGLHYPASDIPKQARALYLKSWLRMKPDNDAADVPVIPALNPVTQQPLDMSYCVLRSMSAIHSEYLRNMGVHSTMSISIIRDGKLWGLVACHHYAGARYVPHEARMACEFLAHMLSLQMVSKEDAENLEYVSRLNSQHSLLVEAMSETGYFRRGLLKREDIFRNWIDADGIAILVDKEVHTLGETPAPEFIEKIGVWLHESINEDVYATNHLSSLLPDQFEAMKTAAGMMAIRLGRLYPQYVIWFRAEIAQTVNWAGNPNKPVEVGEFGERLTPRKSFELWVEDVQGKAEPWKVCEIEAARMLRRSILEIIVRRTEELQKLNEELERSNTELDSFAYIASHDLKEPLRGINNFSHFLLEDYADKLDEDGVSKINALIRLTQRLESLLDSLLHYSRRGRQELNLKTVSLQNILSHTLESIAVRINESGTEVRVLRELPEVKTDEVMIEEVLTNLISNAIKYNNKPEKWVEIGWQEDNTSLEPRLIFFVRDNGIGIAPQHQENIFRIFKRLHGKDEFGGGSGAGLTIVKKIITRHNGQVWVESKPAVGSTFYFSLPQS